MFNLRKKRTFRFFRELIGNGGNILKPKYKRVILKLSGEALGGKKGTGIDETIVDEVTDQIKILVEAGVEVAVVIGGGNFWRGRTSEKMDRSTADYMGMMATVINALALQDSIEQKDMQSRVMSAIEMRQIAEPYIKRRAVRHLEKGRVVIFGGGTGNPYFTTDSAAVLRAIEIEADVILKGTRVDGIYDTDPEKDDKAIKFNFISFEDVLKKGLKVMDTTAFTLSQENELPIIVFDMNKKGNLLKVVSGEKIGTEVNI